MLLVLGEILDDAAEFFAVFGAHMYKFDAGAVGLDISHHGDGMNGSQAALDLHREGIADLQAAAGLQASAAQTDNSDAGCRGQGALDAGPPRAFERKARLAARAGARVVGR